MGLIWQIVKLYLFNQITIANVPGLINLLREGEDLTELMKLSPEEILLRWVNYQLEKVWSILYKYSSRPLITRTVYNEGLFIPRILVAPLF